MTDRTNFAFELCRESKEEVLYRKIDTILFDDDDRVNWRALIHAYALARANAGARVSLRHRSPIQWPEFRSPIVINIIRRAARGDAQVFDFRVDTPPRIELIGVEVVRLVREGMRFVAENRLEIPANDPLPKVADELGDEDVARFVKNRFETMLSVLADEQEFLGISRYKIATSEGFTNRIDLEIRDRIPVAPKKFNSLSEYLHRDITSYMSRGGEVGAAWGRLELDGVEIIMALNAQPRALPRKGRGASVEYYGDQDK